MYLKEFVLQKLSVTVPGLNRYKVRYVSACAKCKSLTEGERTSDLNTEGF